MTHSPWLRIRASIPAALLAFTFVCPAQQVPLDVGTTVSGYQDDFDGASLSPGWVARGANVYSVNNGTLRITSAGGDPNHLLYEVAGYDNTVQEVLARIRVLNFGTGDGPRGGVAAGVDSGSSQGINFHFRDEGIGKHIEFLDDARAWGTEFPFTWQLNTWYWLRLRQEPNAASQGGVNDVFGKIWLADGSQAEPANWQTTYEYIPTRSTRTGFAGLAASSLGGTAEFDVDYVLIKAAGLPSVTVAPRAFVQTPVAITNQPQSVVVLQCQSATFTVGASGNPVPTFQWYKDPGGAGFAAIPDATNASLTVTNIQMADSGSLYRVVAQNVVSNTTYSITSAVAVLTVSADTTPPLLVGAQALGLSQVRVIFSEPVTSMTANEVLNYQITNAGGSVVISNAVLDATKTNVTLTCATLTDGAAYTLVVNAVIDECEGNTIAPDSTATFTATSYAVQNIGNASPPGTIVPTSGGLDVSGGGSDIGGTSDQFQFAWQQRAGDFDVKVRIASLGLSDSWAEAGMMARETLDTGARFASAMATPSISGCYFQSRGATNGGTSLSGSFPANYPNTWLRLRRVGNQFTGFASYDGASWTTLGSVAVAMPTNIYFGFAVSSHNTNQLTTAAFRDFSAVTNTSTNTAPINVEPLGQSSRRTSLVISEIMYHPAERADGRNTEFIELFNALGEPQDISGYRLSGEVEFTFPTNTLLPAGGFAVVARVPADVEFVYGISGVVGPFANTNNLSNQNGTIRLRHRTGAVLLEVNYASDPPFPLAADGAGHSLILARPSFGEGNPLAWGISDEVGGSPGRLDPVTLDPLRNVVINEFLAHTDLPAVDYIELYNHSNEAIDLSGCSFSDNPATNKFIIPPDTIIPARGFAVFYETNLNFALSSHGEEIYFRNAAGTRVLDAIRFEPQENGVSFGRWPNGASSFYRMSAQTPGAANIAPRTSDVVINEIMYNPISGDSADEFIELYNGGTNTVDLYRWRIIGGVSITFRAGTMLPPNSYLVVANNITNLLARYGNLHSNNTVGNFNGSLANGGERIALTMPDLEVSTNALGQLVTNAFDIVVNEVTYGDGGRWGQWSDGGGSSLELIDARADNRLAANWADSDETAKAPWTLASFTGILDNPHSAGVLATHLEMFLQGVGECLIDDVEVLETNGANRISNSSFQAGLTGWTAEGTQSGSTLETTEGYGSSQSLHVRAVDRGDNQVNRIRTALNATIAAGQRATIRARLRWLRGHPEFLLKLRGNWLEMPVTMVLPANLGTPGARNSRAATNAAPAIYDVTHAPVLPQANEPVVVTARASDPDGVSLQLKYRNEPTLTFATVPMNDVGTNGDAIAGDGLFSATIPGAAAATLTAFYVQATDAYNATNLFPNNAPVRECLVRFGEVQPFGNFPTYRIWMTAATLSTWTSRHRLNNTPLDVTFVLNNSRAIYNAQALYAGSPYIAPGYNTPVGNRCGYTLVFPTDDRFLGGRDLVLDWPGGHGNEPTAIQEQMAYWLADQMNIAFSYRHFIRLHVNGVTEASRGTIYEAVMQPASEYLNEWSFGDEDGDFYKIDRGFEFDDGGNRIADPMPTLQNFMTTNVGTGLPEKKRARYRWIFMKRAFDSANDYTNIFALVDAVNAASYEPYTSQTEGLVDVEQWMRIFAFEHTINNFDSYGHAIGKNMYAYKPERGPWQLYPFDLDWLMLVSVSAGYGTSGDLFVSNDSVIGRMYNHPPFRRAYWRAYQDIVDGPLQNALADPVMDAKYYSLVQNGVTQSEGNALQTPATLKTWWSGRRAYIQSQLQAQAANFTVSNPATVTTNNNLVQVSGTAPFGIKSIEFNGVAYPITWAAQNNWTARVPVNLASNVVTIVGYDRNGQPVAGASNQITIQFTGTLELAAGNIVINELMFHGAVEDSEYLELFNAATNTTFDLSGWRLHGLDYTFPEGSTIGPRSFVVLARNRSVFSATYGGTIPVFDEFSGTFQRDGETISLIDTNGAFIARVRYEPARPWSTTADGTGSSFQLIDARQENTRAGNWFSDHVPAVYSPEVTTPAQTNGGWRFARATGGIGGGVAGGQMRLGIYLGTELGSAIIDDLMLVSGTNAGVGTNFVRNGDFESLPLIETTNLMGTNYLLTNSWSIGTNYTNTSIIGDLVHGGNGALKIVASSFGNTFPRLMAQNLSPAPVTNTINTLSFWYWATNSATNLNVKIFNSAALNIVTNINPTVTPATYVPPMLISAGTNYLSPGATNQRVMNLPAFPPLWINEVQPENLTGMTDVAGDREPWIEIYNASTNAVPLEGLFLASSYTNLTEWAFPAGASIGATQFLVIFCDGETEEATGSEYHTSFRLPAAEGSVALSRIYSNAPQVIDYVNYRGVRGDRSFGSFPDGQPFARQEFFYVTPRGTNDGRSEPIVVFINEWMAGNSSYLADPADGDFDDWFELYNPSTNTVDLGGYFLTDTLALPFEYQIPPGYTIAPRGRLLVWADKETGQNRTNRIDLHANFQLATGGEALGLFAPDGRLVDAITFGQQTNNISQGRCPDGATNIIFMNVPTPRTANVGCGVQNSAPVLAAIEDKFVYAGQMLSFTASAIDAETPPQVLTYSIDSGAPVGAIMNPETGLFTWTPSPSQAGTYNLTVRVRDDGIPSLEDSETVAITAALPPGFTGALRNGNTLELTWQTRAGRVYRVEATDDLANPNWQPVTGDLPATGDSLSVTNAMTGAQRFFRITVTDG